MYLKQEEHLIPILVEDEAWPGVKRIVEKVADDFALVFDVRPAVLTRHQAKKEKADQFFDALENNKGNKENLYLRIKQECRFQ